jgi:predicted Rdx family selenoprotein
MRAIRKDLWERKNAGEIVEVDKGEPLGLMGGSGISDGKVGCVLTAFPTHVHFEIKKHTGQGDKQTNPQYWGYTPGHPDLYGYVDPWQLMAPFTPEYIAPTVVSAASAETPILNAPVDSYSGKTPFKVSVMGSGQKLVATRMAITSGKTWYFVDFPSSNSSVYGPTGGWVSAVNPDLTAMRVAVSKAPTSGEAIREQPMEGGAVFGRVFSDQYLALADPVPSNPGGDIWLRVYLPKRNQTPTQAELPARTGWILSSKVQILGAGANLQCVAKETGAPVAGATIKVGEATIGTTDASGRISIPANLMGDGIITLIKDFLNFTGLVKVASAAELASAEVIEVESSASPPASTRFSIGDDIEVFGTGIGLRGRYPDPASPTYRVLDDGTQGHVIDGPQASGGYNRWKIRFDSLGIDVWCAEGEPDGSAFYLRMATAPAVDALEPNNSSSSATLLTLGGSVQSYVSSPADVDWFKVVVTTPGQLAVNLTVPAGLDYDLELYAPDGTWKAGSYNPTGAAENINYGPTITGTYYLRVYGYPVGSGAWSETTPYTLTTTFATGPITIASQPQSVTIPWGAAATFSVSASSAADPNLCYQWRRNGTLIPGATRSTFTTLDTSMSRDGDDYSVAITNRYGSVASDSANLDVNDPPSIYWTGEVSNNWDEPQNWNLSRIPDGTDVVRISAGDSVSATSGASAWHVIVGGTLNWHGGTVNCALTVASGGVLNLSSDGDKYLSGGVLTNGGTVNWSGGNIRLDYGAAVNNLAGGTFNVLCAKSLYWSNGNQASFSNAGTFRKSGDDGTAYLSGVNFTNTGLVELLSGSISASASFSNDGTLNNASGVFTMSGGGTSNGTFYAGAGAANELSGNEVFGTGVSFTGEGTHRAASNLSLNGVYGFQGLVVSGGISGTFTLNGSMTFTGGTINGEITIGPGSVLNLSGDGDKYLSGGVLTNGGTVNWSGGNIRLDYGAVVNNLAGGTFKVLCARSLYWSNGNQASFSNAGIFRKSGDGGTAYLSSVAFTNTGLVDAQDGTIQIAGGNGTSNGSFNAASGATMSYANVSFADGTSFTGAGVNRIVGPVGMTGSVTSQNLELAAGSIGGNATITAVGTMSWTGGAISCSLTMSPGCVLNLSGDGDKYLSGGVLTNGGTVNWSGGNIRLDYGAAVNNLAGGTFNMLCAKSLYWSNGNPPSFNNAGTMDVEASIVYISGFSPNLETGSVLKGAGHLGNTTLNISGDITVQDFELIYGNTITGTGNGTITGTLNWLGGTVGCALTVASGGVLNISGDGDKYLSGGVLTNGGTVNWSGGNIRLDYGAVVNNLAGGTFNVLCAKVLYWSNGNQASFSNAGIFRKSGDGGTAYLSGINPTNTGLMELLSGSLSVSGNFAQSETGKIKMQIAGSSPGAEYNQMIVNGQANLAGLFEATFANGFVPSNGQTFTLMSFGSRMSGFSAIESPLFGQDLKFEPSLSATSFSLNVVRTAFATWKSDKFGDQASDPMVSGAMSDPNQNGTPNLLEFAFGMEPLLPGQLERLPNSTFATVSEQEYLAISFRRLVDPNARLTYRVLETTDLNNWTAVNMQECQVGLPESNGDGTETVTVRASQPISGPTSRPSTFLRVEVAEK